MRKAGTAHTKTSNDMENHVFIKAKTRVSNTTCVSTMQADMPTLIPYRHLHCHIFSNLTLDKSSGTYLGCLVTSVMGEHIHIHFPDVCLSSPFTGFRLLACIKRYQWMICRVSHWLRCLKFSSIFSTKVG